jgi:hypothetical protein
MNNWVNLCKQITPLIKGNVSEDVFHNSFISYLETTFNWENANINSKFPVKMGTATKEADIVLKGNDFTIVIEMKRPDIILSNDHEDQLFSYMRILGIKYGLLIGNKIKFFYDHNHSVKPYEIASINLDPNNEDGKMLGEILDYTVCSNDKLYNYSKAKLESFQKAKRIENFKCSLEENNFEKVKVALGKSLLFDGYDEEEKRNILSNMVIYFKNKPVDTISSAQSINIENRNGSNNQNSTENTINDNFLDEVMGYYNSICDTKFIAFGNNPKWRQIAIHKNSKIRLFHYEFIIRSNSRIGIEIHNETNHLRNLNSVMATFNGIIQGYTINNREINGRNRIEIFVPYSAGKEVCSLVMVELIKMTHEKIIEECNKLNIL